MTLIDLMRMSDACKGIHGTDEPLVWVMGVFAELQVLRETMDAHGPIGHGRDLSLNHFLGYPVFVDREADPQFLYLMRRKDYPNV